MTNIEDAYDGVYDHGVFQNCSGLTSVTIPNSVTSIGGYAFSGCSGLNCVTIGIRVNNIGNLAFASCDELTDVHCLAEAVPSTGANVFKDSYIEHATLHVPTTSIDAYNTVEPWKNFKNIIAINDVPPKGDVNGDLVIDVADIASVITVMANGAEGTNPLLKAADVNGDGTVDVADIATIISEMAARAREQKKIDE